MPSFDQSELAHESPSRIEYRRAIHPSVSTTLRLLGYDEYWLQSWIVEDPTRLGLGSIIIKAKELRHYSGKGGRLDILGYDSSIDTYYEIEVMLGECDADHGFRTLDYWARERIRSPNARHVAVIVAEDLSGRYRTAIEALAQQLPLIAVEIRTLLIKSDPETATTFPIIIAKPDDFVLRGADDPETEERLTTPNDPGTWEDSRPEFTQLARDIHKALQRKNRSMHNRLFGKKLYCIKKRQTSLVANLA